MELTAQITHTKRKKERTRILFKNYKITINLARIIYKNLYYIT